MSLSNLYTSREKRRGTGGLWWNHSPAKTLQSERCRRISQVCEINRSCGVLTIKISEGDETTGMMAYSIFGWEGIISKWGFVALHPWLSDPFPHHSSFWSAGNNQRGLGRAACSQNSRRDVSSSARLLCDWEEMCAQLCLISYVNLGGTDWRSSAAIGHPGDQVTACLCHSKMTLFILFNSLF